MSILEPAIIIYGINADDGFVHITGYDSATKKFTLKESPYLISPTFVVVSKSFVKHIIENDLYSSIWRRYEVNQDQDTLPFLIKGFECSFNKHR